MRTNRDKTSNSLGVQRRAVPECSQLQKNIIEETQRLVQVTANNENRSLFTKANIQISRLYKSLTDNGFRFQPIAMTTAIVLLTVIFSTNQTINPPIKSIEPIDQITWEELWLMQDELAFAEI